ncbi:hypothetical protein Tco_0246773 [Tanacetum coccineum]
MTEEQELTKEQKKRKAQVQFEAQPYTEEDWDTIRAKLEANAELKESVLRRILLLKIMQKGWHRLECFVLFSIVYRCAYLGGTATIGLWLQPCGRIAESENRLPEAAINAVSIVYRCPYLGGAATTGLWLQPWLLFESGRVAESENRLPQQPP